MEMNSSIFRIRAAQATRIKLPQMTAGISALRLHIVRPGSFLADLLLALRDLRDGVLSTHVWPMLGWLEIQRRYRRSVLGPLWLTISTAAMVGAMGPLYGKLFGQELSVYFPYLATSMVVWMLLSALIVDSCNTFISMDGMIKDVRLPFTVYVLSVVWRNLLIFLHNLIVVLIVVSMFGKGLGWGSLQALIGLAFVALNGIWFGLLLGLLCARFRDIPQIVISLMQIAMFLTPVMWPAGMLGQHEWAVTWNPLFHFLQVVRNPLLGNAVELLNWMAVCGITVGGFAVTLLVFARYRRRIAYWL